MGITHHAHGVKNVQAIANLALLRGMVGRPGCGLMPIRGHSNVQGIGSVGVMPKLKDVIFEVLYPGPRHPVRSVADLQSVLSKLKTGDYISLNVHSLSQGAGDRVVNIRIGG